MKIFHVCSYYLGTKLYQNLLESLLEKDTENIFYVPTFKKYETGFELHPNVSISNILNKYDRVVFAYKHRKILKDVLKKFDFSEYDVIHAHSTFSNGYIAYQISKRFNIPYIIAFRNTDLNTFFEKMPHLRGIGIEIMNNAGKIVFLSAAYRDKVLEKHIPEHLRRSILEKSVIIPNGIDRFWLENINTHERPDGRIRIICVGAISPGKNPLATLEACKILIKRGYEVSFTVIGKIVNRTIHDKLAQESFVKYCPYMPREELIEYYRKNEIFVMPSVMETFGLVYAEAMSQGLPVIYSKGQGFDSQFDEGEVGFHVNCNDHGEIADRIELLYNSYSETSKRAAAMCKRFDWDKIAETYIQVYSKVRGNH